MITHLLFLFFFLFFLSSRMEVGCCCECGMCAYGSVSSTQPLFPPNPQQQHQHQQHHQQQTTNLARPGCLRTEMTFKGKEVIPNNNTVGRQPRPTGPNSQPFFFLFSLLPSYPFACACACACAGPPHGSIQTAPPFFHTRLCTYVRVEKGGRRVEKGNQRPRRFGTRPTHIRYSEATPQNPEAPPGSMILIRQLLLWCVCVCGGVVFFGPQTRPRL
ncbi:hypothetical protein QBC42DRAFT_265335 [Cladorrhinum samala]|uniref:Secreted protein n=1 Tax=Cladorrhinum samala TaxID=585594 RepID=A0AAV9HV27_9PEZI|nr:hypothetical protein QBC42DRAFT_265335 [Cladorrhinum samala]